MNATKAAADLIRADLEMRRFFLKCCKIGPYWLRRHAARRFRLELATRGHWYGLQEIGDALAEIARKSLPKTPAGGGSA